MLSNCGTAEDCWESLGQQRDPTVNLKGSQLWILIRRTYAESETPVLWPSDANSWFIGKVPNAGKDWGQKKKASEDEMAGSHHWSMDVNLSKLQETGRDREAWRATVQGVAKSWRRLGNWTATTTNSLHTNPQSSNFQRCECAFTSSIT